MEAPQSDIEPQSIEPQSLQTPVEKEDRSRKKRKAAIQTPVTRCTRSRAEPEWTLKEMLILVREITSVEEDCLKALSTYQKWSIISTNCMALDVVRSSNQCRRKWDSMVVDYKKIKDWETHSPFGSYWSLSIEQKTEFDLPVLFDDELFGLICDLLNILEVRSDSEVESETEGLIGAAESDKRDIGVDSGSKKEKKRRKLSKEKVEKELDVIRESEPKALTGIAATETRDIVVFSGTKKEKTRLKSSKEKVENENDVIRGSETIGLIGTTKTETRDVVVYSGSKKEKTRRKPSKDELEKQQGLVRELRENSQTIHAILRKNLLENVNDSLAGFEKTGNIQTNLKRWQGDELIKVLGGLIGTLNHFAELVQESN